MFPRLLPLWIILPLLFAASVRADEPIREIRGVKPKRAAFKPGGAKKPLVIKSDEDAAKHFDAENLAALKKEIDFSKQIVLLFAWRGSGQDRIEYAVLESFPEQVLFSYHPGRTRDLRPHVKVFVLRANVKWSVKQPRRAAARAHLSSRRENGPTC